MKKIIEENNERKRKKIEQENIEREEEIKL